MELVLYPRVEEIVAKSTAWNLAQNTRMNPETWCNLPIDIPPSSEGWTMAGERLPCCLQPGHIGDCFPEI